MGLLGQRKPNVRSLAQAEDVEGLVEATRYTDRVPTTEGVVTGCRGGYARRGRSRRGRFARVDQVTKARDGTPGQLERLALRDGQPWERVQ